MGVTWDMRSGAPPRLPSACANAARHTTRPTHHGIERRDSAQTYDIHRTEHRKCRAGAPCEQRGRLDVPHRRFFGSDIIRAAKEDTVDDDDARHRHEHDRQIEQERQKNDSGFPGTPPTCLSGRRSMSPPVRDSRGTAAPTLSAALYRFKAFNSQLLPLTIANAATPKPIASMRSSMSVRCSASAASPPISITAPLVTKYVRIAVHTAPVARSDEAASIRHDHRADDSRRRPPRKQCRRRTLPLTGLRRGSQRPTHSRPCAPTTARRR